MIAASCMETVTTTEALAVQKGPNFFDLRGCALYGKILPR